MLLLVWGCIDQVHYYLALQKQNLAALRRAASLVPYDRPLEMRLANRALEEGLPQDSIMAWQYAIESDHADPGPRDAYPCDIFCKKNALKLPTNLPATGLSLRPKMPLYW